MDCIAYFSGSVTITDHIGFNVPGHLKYLLHRCLIRLHAHGIYAGICGNQLCSAVPFHHNTFRRKFQHLCMQHLLQAPFVHLVQQGISVVSECLKSHHALHLNHGHIMAVFCQVKTHFTSHQPAAGKDNPLSNPVHAVVCLQCIHGPVNSLNRRFDRVGANSYDDGVRFYLIQDFPGTWGFHTDIRAALPCLTYQQILEVPQIHLILILVCKINGAAQFPCFFQKRHPVSAL